MRNTFWISNLKAIVSLAVLLGCASLALPTAHAEFGGSEPKSVTTGASNGTPPSLPPRARPFGKSYSEWAAEWWKWYLAIPASTHPVLDETGENCEQGQGGKVWFLAGAFVVEERDCTVPVGKAILFPVINAECSTLEEPPFFGSNEQELRACVEAIQFSDADMLTVTVDGQDVRNPLRYRFTSPIFYFSIPDDNIIGVDTNTKGNEGQSVAGGYYIMLPPLSQGEHVIQFQGVLGTGPFAGFSQDVTYNLIVE
jgi:hypothetical protein